MHDRDPANSSTIQIDFSRFNKPPQTDYDHQMAVFNRDLYPYESDAFLYQRITGQNRLLRRAPELRDHIYAALAADDDDSLLHLISTIEQARQYYTPQNEKPINSLLSYITLVHVTNYTANAIGPEHTFARINALDEFIARNIVDSLDEAQIEEVQVSLNYLLHRVQQLHALTDQTILYAIYVKLMAFRHHLHQRKQAFLYFNILPDNRGVYPSYEQANQDSYEIGELFSHIRATQHYGVKMGYVGDKRGGTLVFSPPLDIENDPVFAGTPVHPLMTHSNTIADIMHSPKTQHHRIKRELEDKTGYFAAGVNIDSVIAMSLGQDGELYTDRDCRTPLRDIAIQKGKYHAYRDLQATILAHYSDLTHPLEQVFQAQQAATTQRIPHPQEHTDPLEPIRRLIIPRIYIAAQRNAGPQSEQPSRTIRRHEVTWHVRHLPDGWRASPSAIELAESLGVKLNENETIVREHKRGSLLLGEVTAHQFIVRPDET